MVLSRPMPNNLSRPSTSRPMLRFFPCQPPVPGTGQTSFRWERSARYGRWICPFPERSLPVCQLTTRLSQSHARPQEEPVRDEPTSRVLDQRTKVERGGSGRAGLWKASQAGGVSKHASLPVPTRQMLRDRTVRNSICMSCLQRIPGDALSAWKKELSGCGEQLSRSSHGKRKARGICTRNLDAVRAGSGSASNFR